MWKLWRTAATGAVYDCVTPRLHPPEHRGRYSLFPGKIILQGSNTQFSLLWLLGVQLKCYQVMPSALFSRYLQALHNVSPLAALPFTRDNNAISAQKVIVDWRLVEFSTFDIDLHGWWSQYSSKAYHRSFIHCLENHLSHLWIYWDTTKKGCLNMVSPPKINSLVCLLWCMSRRCSS